MTTRGLLGGLALLAVLSSVPLTADGQTAKVAPPKKDMPKMAPINLDIDSLDFVFAASDRPVLVRLHLRKDGRPYATAWDDYMKKFFAYFDQNGDGVLDKKEAERAPNMQFLRFHLQGSIGFPYDGQTVRMQQIDTDKDGKVSFAEFTGFYQRAGFGPLQFSNGSNRASTDAVTNTLYKYLDANKDGKLSADELAKAPTALRRLDFDEDEMLTANELRPGGNNSSGGALPRARGAMAPNADMGFLEIKPGTVEGVARQVLTHYDKNKNGKLDRDELTVDEALFDRLDANRDDQLDAKEFAGFFQRDADLELMARIGNLDQAKGLFASLVRNLSKEMGGMKAVRAEVFNPSKRSMPLAAKVQRDNGSGLSFGLGDARIELSVGEQTNYQFNNIKQFYTEQFKQADTDKKGVIDRKKAKAAQFLDMLFVLVDRNGDGQLTEKELTAYLDMQVQGGGCQMQLSITDEGRSLFDVLDVDGDGRLSIRELRTGWSRMKPLAKSEVGLSPGDIARRLTISTGQGGFRRIRTAVQAYPGGPTAQAKGSKSPPPLWFTKMDRNHDGDLSPREFLGTDEDFRKLDADGDGLISADEAGQFEARLKKEKQVKRRQHHVTTLQVRSASGG